MSKIRTILLFAFALSSMSVSALDIPAGKFYFDNSRTQYSNVKFVYGSNSREECYVVSMTNEGEGRWSVTIPETIRNMYRYTFAETSLSDGSQGQNFNTVKDAISNIRNEKRTATREDEIVVGWIFTPNNGDNWAQGAWLPLNPTGGENGSTSYSGTLPVMYISTLSDGNVPSFCTYIDDCYFAYFENTGQWDEVGCYIWQRNSSYLTGNWPGQACELVGVAENGNNVWLWKSSQPKNGTQAPENIIFNNNQNTGVQTRDLKFVNGGYYTLDMEVNTAPSIIIGEDGVAGEVIPITSKETYVRGTYYIDDLGIDGYEPTGSASAPLGLQIKGRGNYTWTGFEKKPYRLKFDDKASPLGAKKNRHFTLLAHADDELAFLRNTVGFELSRQLGLEYTPSQFPVEVVLNDDYIGLYMLTDKIRVDKDRVNIVEQEDLETDPEKITGGWLLEIDNYDEDEQVRITEGNGAVLRFTYHTPEMLSTAQREYLYDFVTATDKAIYSSNKNRTDWEDYIDIDALARFYIVQEVMDNAESFHGSCYMHKELGEDTKLIFGPVWDFGNSFRRGTDRFIYEYAPYGQNWIGEIAKYAHFQEKVKEVWQDFYPSKYAKLGDFIDGFVSQIAGAAACDAARWPNYGHSDVANRSRIFMDRMDQKVEFLRRRWGEGSGVDVVAAANKPKIGNNVVYDMQGRKVAIAENGNIRSLQLSPDIYIFNGAKVVVR